MGIWKSLFKSVDKKEEPLIEEKKITTDVVYSCDLFYHFNQQNPRSYDITEDYEKALRTCDETSLDHLLELIKFSINNQVDEYRRKSVLFELSRRVWLTKVAIRDGQQKKKDYYFSELSIIEQTLNTMITNDPYVLTKTFDADFEKFKVSIRSIIEHPVESVSTQCNKKKQPFCREAFKSAAIQINSDCDEMRGIVFSKVGTFTKTAQADMQTKYLDVIEANRKAVIESLGEALLRVFPPDLPQLNQETLQLEVKS